MSTDKFNLGQNLDGKRIQLTKKGVEELKNKLENLINVDRVKILEELSEARAQGDLSENAEYDAAKNKQAEIEAEIANLQNILSRVEIISESVGSNVKLGSTVELEKENGTIMKIQIVSSIQSNPLSEIPLIGIDSPLAKAILGLKVGDIKRIETAKPYKITIKKIT